MTTPTTAPGRLLNISEVAHETGIHRATIYRRIQSGQFPKPVSLGSRTSRWLESEINAWKLALIE